MRTERTVSRAVLTPGDNSSQTTRPPVSASRDNSVTPVLTPSSNSQDFRVTRSAVATMASDVPRQHDSIPLTRSRVVTPSNTHVHNHSDHHTRSPVYMPSRSPVYMPSSSHSIELRSMVGERPSAPLLSGLFDANSSFRDLEIETKMSRASHRKALSDSDDDDGDVRRHVSGGVPKRYSHDPLPNAFRSFSGLALIISGIFLMIYGSSRRPHPVSNLFLSCGLFNIAFGLYFIPKKQFVCSDEA